ncbi:hypothetical protein [Bacillus cytotoxicus]|uniref:hypothetical protein n=1 Tax=Bacillus cytotoxicus TaxID=580165 RepID=UPI003D7D393A
MVKIFTQEQKLNKLALEFKRNPEEETFNELYKLSHKVVGGFVKGFSNRKSGVDNHDILALYDDTLLAALDKLGDYEDSNFTRLFRMMLSKNKLNVFRKQARRRNKETLDTYISDEEMESSSFLDSSVLPPIKEEKIKKEYEQSILLVIESVDDFTREVINAFLFQSSNFKLMYTEISRIVGSNPKKVERTCKKLRKEYASGKFGDLLAYPLDHAI